MSFKTNILRQLKEAPKTVRQLRTKLACDTKRLQKALRELEQEGKVSNKKGLYSAMGDAGKLVEARVVKLGRSFAFVAPLDGSADIFIPGHSLNAALPRDIVAVEEAAFPRVKGSREGEVAEIMESCPRVVGTVSMLNGRLVLTPDDAPDTPLLIKRNADGGVKEGEKAAGQILERGERHQDIRIGIIQRFGSADSAKQCAKAILYSQGVVKGFPAAVKDEAKAVSEQNIPSDALENRTDLRKETVFTIDANSTKDIDDAISVEKTSLGYKLGVHIADVSYYVLPESELDREAFSRGNSIYYADSVIPMLPKALSNGICSLNPGEDRLAFSCLMDIDKNGRMLDYQFVKTVICSRVKGVYTEINAILEGTAEPDIQKKYANVADMLVEVRHLYEALARARDVRGAMDIESDEAKLVIDEEGICVGVEKQQRGISERMIEEFMLMANTAAAHLARRRELPFVYRVHEQPSLDKVTQLKLMLKAAGVDFKFGSDIPTQPELAALLEKTRDTSLEVPVHTAVLRSMAKARYDAVPLGHYGLTLQDYAHFTSPIRRYPDLAIHRILSDVVSGVRDEQVRKRYKGFVAAASKQSSERELVAQQVERDCDDCYKAEFMKKHLGESFDGVISSVTSFGVYVSLPNTVEGLVHVSALSSHALELRDGFALYDAVSGKSYKLGEPLRVKVAGVNVAMGHVDFVPS